jgi:hypothetical protein
MLFYVMVLSNDESVLCGFDPSTLVPGDQVCALQGGTVPMILRQVGEHALLFGEAKVPLILNGEAMKGIADGEDIPEFSEMIFALSLGTRQGSLSLAHLLSRLYKDAAVDVPRQRSSDFHRVPRFTHNANTNPDVMAEGARCARAAGGASSALPLRSTRQASVAAPLLPLVRLPHGATLPLLAPAPRRRIWIRLHPDVPVLPRFTRPRPTFQATCSATLPRYRKEEKGVVRCCGVNSVSGDEHGRARDTDTHDPSKRRHENVVP